MRSTLLALRIWLSTSLIFGFGWLIYIIFDPSMPLWSPFVATIAALIASLPVLLILVIIIPVVNKATVSKAQKKLHLIAVCIIICFGYGLIISIALSPVSKFDFFETFLISTGALITCTLLSITICSKHLYSFFTENLQLNFKKNKNMEPTMSTEDMPVNANPAPSNRILYKGIITGVLILVMLIPTIFISNLVHERQERQSQVTNEVSEKWAQAQTLTGPYIYLPYKVITVDNEKHRSEQLKHLVIIPDNLLVNGQISHELRLRSIYKVLLYRAALNNSGNFQFDIPKGIDSSLVQWRDAKICYGLSDFKGIEERLVISFKGLSYELSPGLPFNDINEKGLSASIPLSNLDEGQKMNFNISLKIKGSEQLHFIPLSGDSKFTLRSTWPNPSFDGSNLPSVRTINDSGFTASWTFNKANLPFGTVLDDFKFNEKSLAFGVTMIQPADGYAKTNRCIKYAILFIGLTFSLFFIIELMQKKAVHPVQYILIGLALIIFYTLLLSISEFITFDFSYLIASIATILLISLYAYGHFRRGKTAGIFASFLCLLYGFTFVLIRLEDTALLIGSIGLFIILAIAMYFSRKINWYPETTTPLIV